MIDYLIYGKIIIDDVRLRSGELVARVLGGGGPQAVVGARLWSDSVGFLSRSGTDLDAEIVDDLRGLDADLGGWVQYPDIPTPRTRMQYDAEEYLTGGLITSQDDWTRLLAEPLALPPTYEQPKAIHLITEFPDEPMVDTALDLQARGAVLSLEPLVTRDVLNDWGRMLALIGQVDIVAPDWPTASGVAGSDDPHRVIRHWAALGPAVVAVRHGARGSYVWSRACDEAWHIPAVPVAVVDPTGAGNAYGGGLCVGWTEANDVCRAGCQGAVSASLLVRQVGLPRMTAAVRREARDLLDEATTAARRM